MLTLPISFKSNHSSIDSTIYFNPDVTQIRVGLSRFVNSEHIFEEQGGVGSSDKVNYAIVLQQIPFILRENRE